MITKKSEIKEIKTINAEAIRNLALGYDGENFILAFNKDDEDMFEMAYIIEADRLKEIVMMLFEAGIHYEKETGKDIGFTAGEDNE